MIHFLTKENLLFLSGQLFLVEVVQLSVCDQTLQQMDNKEYMQLTFHVTCLFFQVILPIFL
jgi:hypothetical protein